MTPILVKFELLRIASVRLVVRAFLLRVALDRRFRP
jgi:hypothetical protein